MTYKLPKYNSVKLTGPTAVARKTMPSVPVLDPSFEYTPAVHTDLKKKFREVHILRRSD